MTRGASESACYRASMRSFVVGTFGVGRFGVGRFGVGRFGVGTFVAVGLVLGSACDGVFGLPDAAPACQLALDFAAGDDGHPAPLGSSPSEARAGRVGEADLPPDPSGLLTWRPGDFLLANDRVAMVIEATGASDLYDPWGGRPVGVARVEAGRMTDAPAFGEILLLIARQSVVTRSVSVLADGQDGGPAIIRAAGTLAPLPFFEAIVAGIYSDLHADIPTAIDYVLEPGAEHVDLYFVHRSPRNTVATLPSILHGFMYTPRMPLWAPRVGFDTGVSAVPWLGFVDDSGASFAYEWPHGPLDPGVSVSGFVSRFTAGYDIAACAETRRHHARITIGGRGLDGLVEAMARREAAPLRAVTGTVRDAAGAPAAGVRVHARLPGGQHLTRATTDATGAFTLHVPAGDEVDLVAYRRGDEVSAPLRITAAQLTADLALAATGVVHVFVTDAASLGALPARVQMLPAEKQGIPSLPPAHGEPGVTGGRLHVEYAVTGEATMVAPVGDWEVVVSRGYEYELHRQTVTVAAGATVEVEALLDRVVATDSALCADFHIHTRRSNDSGDDAIDKVRAAVADGLELPVRSEHEYVEDFQPIVAALGLEEWAHGLTSVELTSMELWGHMGVFPLEPEPLAVNGGTPLWQSFPTAEDPGAPLVTLSPRDVFAAVRARPEQPTIIINHPRGSTNYFGYVGFDAVTGLVDRPEDWDEEFTLVEVFNDSGWLANRDGTVADWFGLLSSGRRVFAVGSSDSHSLSGSPVGYPRTCLRLGTDDPRAVTPNGVRDAAAAGHATVSGGIYVDAWAGGVGPGDELLGVGETVPLRVRVQAATWVDVDFLDVVVDGQTVETIAILPADTDPENAVIRFDRELTVNVTGPASYVLFAAYGDAALEPVHPGRLPFGVTNPIFLRR